MGHIEVSAGLSRRILIALRFRYGIKGFLEVFVGPNKK
jgi:hypothetical protein